MNNSRPTLLERSIVDRIRNGSENDRELGRSRNKSRRSRSRSPEVNEIYDRELGRSRNKSRRSRSRSRSLSLSPVVSRRPQADEQNLNISKYGNVKCTVCGDMYDGNSQACSRKCMRKLGAESPQTDEQNSTISKDNRYGTVDDMGI